MFECVYWTKQLTQPTVSPCISVKLKSHDFAKWVKILLRIILQKYLVINQRRLLRERRLARVQDGLFDDVYVDKRLSIGRCSSS